jgi:hypothetical protein
MKYSKLSLSVSQRKQQQKKQNLISFSNICVIKKDTDTKAESKLKILKVKNQFSEQLRNWLKTR